MNNLEQQLKIANESIRQSQIQNQKKETIETLIQLMSASYDKATAYSNLILIGGYAIFFTVWGKMYNELPSFNMKLSALFMLASVLFFISWEIYKMIFYSDNLKGLYKITEETNPEKFLTDLNNYKLNEKKKSLRLVKIWYFVLIITIIPGVLGGAILLVSFANNLLK
jgi:hypothetical protein